MSSPLERCQQTAQFIAEPRGLAVETDARLIECGYGDWTGQEIKKLSQRPAVEGGAGTPERGDVSRRRRRGDA